MRLSVIIPTHNRLPLLKRCIESVLPQAEKYPKDCEIIVVDDGSTDDTYSWLLSQNVVKQQLKVLHTEGVGVAEARNIGIRAASGKYIRFIDSDDAIEPNSLTFLVQQAESTKSDLVIGGYSRIIGKQCTEHNIHFDHSDLSIDEYLLAAMHCPNSYYIGVVWNKLFRSDIIEKNNIQFRSGLHFGEDFIFVNQYLQYCDTVWAVDKSVYRYYCNMNSMTTDQVKSCFFHPFQNIHDKQLMYHSYRSLYVKKRLYEKHKRAIDSYYLRIGIAEE